MPQDITPKALHKAAQSGFKRMENFRQARLMFLRQYVGQYYDAEKGEIGNEPLNMIFNAVRSLLPHIVMNFPKHRVHSRYLAYRDYAELLELALNQHSRQTNIKDVYRRALVDAIFTLGILKTGLYSSGSIYTFDEYDASVDLGEVFTEAVSFDNFVADPNSHDHLFRDAAFLGDRIPVSRQALLDSGLYDNALIEQLPSISHGTENEDRAEGISQKNLAAESRGGLVDEVEVIELWVPAANAVVTIPGSSQVSFDKYLRVDDYYGPDSGPYTMLALTPPVSDNPIPVPMVGIWYDLHIEGNRMAKKIIDQAVRQKDIVVYQREAADDAESLRDASDGEAIAVTDVSAINTVSFGGQKNSNEIMLAQLQNWFNQMAANPDQLAGQQINAGSATEARLLQNNATIGLEDAKDLVYQMAASEAAKRAWYFHTDPFIEVPLIKRVEIPSPPITTPMGLTLPGPVRREDVQVYLTPEARAGDWLDYTFDIEPESMARKDSAQRMAEAMDFATKILPAAMQSAQNALMLGIPFNAKAIILMMAKDRGIDWMDEVFDDPEFQMKMMMQMMRGPSVEQSQGTAGGAGGGLDAILQNGQPGQVMGGAPTQDEQFNQESQMGAAGAQSEFRAGGQQAYV